MRLAGSRTLDEFAVGVAEELFELVPGISASYNELNPAAPKAIAAIHPPPTSSGGSSSLPRLSVELLGLSRRQAQVAWLRKDGLTNDQIAAELGITASTVRRHLEDIYPTLGVPSRAAPVARLLDPA